MTSPRHTVWEYASLLVEWSWSTDNGYEYQVSAWSDEDELFSETITSMYWTKPLSRMGRMGWELVGHNPQNVLVNSEYKGYENRPISVPVRTVFFFKRPRFEQDFTPASSSSA